MKQGKVSVIIAWVLMMVLFCSCVSGPASTVIEMELTRNYDDTDPFINEQVIYVSKDLDVLDLDMTFQMEGESTLLEIAELETQQVVWSNQWTDHVDQTDFSVQLHNLVKDKEYVIRLTGINIEHVKLMITSDSKLIKERVHPPRPSKTTSA